MEIWVIVLPNETHDASGRRQGERTITNECQGFFGLEWTPAARRGWGKGQDQDKHTTGINTVEQALHGS